METIWKCPCNKEFEEFQFFVEHRANCEKYNESY